jgi:hypothetical protein
MKRFLKNMIANWKKAERAGKARQASRRGSFRPQLEALEDRRLMSITLPTAPITDMTQWARQTVPQAPTYLLLNFDGNGSNISAFQPQAGQDRDAAIQDIIYRVSEIYSPFNVTVERIQGSNNYPQSGGYTTVFIGGDTNNDTATSSTFGYKYNYSSTPFAYVDYASQFRGFDHGFNSDPYDLAYVDPMQSSTGSRPIGLQAASNPANWINVESDAQI